MRESLSRRAPLHDAALGVLAGRDHGLAMSGDKGLAIGTEGDAAELAGGARPDEHLLAGIGVFEIGGVP